VKRDPGQPWRWSRISLTLNPGYDAAMDDFPVAPPIIVKDTPKPQRLVTLKDARDYVDGALRLGRPQPWREVWHRLKAVADEEAAIEAIGDLRELLADEDLLIPSAS
jgi:hypothetical protein